MTTTNDKAHTGGRTSPDPGVTPEILANLGVAATAVAETVERAKREVERECERLLPEDRERRATASLPPRGVPIPSPVPRRHRGERRCWCPTPRRRG